MCVTNDHRDECVFCRCTFSISLRVTFILYNNLDIGVFELNLRRLGEYCRHEVGKLSPSFKDSPHEREMSSPRV